MAPWDDDDDRTPTAVRLFEILCVLTTICGAVGIIVTPFTWALGWTSGWHTLIALIAGAVGTFCAMACVRGNATP